MESDDYFQVWESMITCVMLKWITVTLTPATTPGYVKGPREDTPAGVNRDLQVRQGFPYHEF